MIAYSGRETPFSRASRCASSWVIARHAYSACGAPQRGTRGRAIGRTTSRPMAPSQNLRARAEGARAVAAGRAVSRDLHERPARARRRVARDRATLAQREPRHALGAALERRRDRDRRGRRDVRGRSCSASASRRTPAKPLLAMAGERFGRLKLNGHLRGYSPLSRFAGARHPRHGHRRTRSSCGRTCATTPASAPACPTSSSCRAPRHHARARFTPAPHAARARSSTRRRPRRESRRPRSARSRRRPARAG